MKIHSQWKIFALGLQVAGWNHGEWVLALIDVYGEEDPFTLSLSQLCIPHNDSAKFEHWSVQWRGLVDTGSGLQLQEKGKAWSEWAVEKRWLWCVPWEDEYPESFKEEEDFPLVVWSSAPLTLRENHIRVGVVGSREASAYGMFACASLVKDLVTQYDCDIVSGCARGIDMSAHKQAVKSAGYTYGFVACGVSFIPAWQRDVFTNQCLVSIFGPNMRAQKWHFAQRNIYLSRFSQGVLVIEAAPKSGTLLTAHSALEHGRPLAVVTHPIFAPNWKGVRSLIDLGAEIVSNATECMEVFLPQSRQPNNSDVLYDEISAMAQTKEELSVLAFLLEQGGSALEQNFPEVFSQQNVMIPLVERGAIVRQAGVVLLSCMIQS